MSKTDKQIWNISEEAVDIRNDDTGEAVEGAADVDQVRDEARSEDDGTDDLQVTIDNLNREIVALRNKAEEDRDALLRTRAEMDNLKKRVDRETENQRRYAAEKYLRDMLPILDSVELGLQAAADQSTDKEAMREGMKMTVALFESFIKGLGANALSPEGESFNPEQHEAIAVQEYPGKPKGQVLTVVQKGYMLHDRLVRPAKVVVTG